MDKSDFNGLKGVIYSRRSTDSHDQREHSNKEQVELCRKMCEEYGIELPYPEYSDRGNSGLGDRPGFQKLKIDIDTGKISPDVIICEKMDRITRQTAKKFIRDIEKIEHIPFVFLIGNGGERNHLINFGDMDDLPKFLNTTLELFQNNQYSISLSNRLTGRLMEKSKRGELCGRDCFGWHNEKTYVNGDLVDWKPVPKDGEYQIVQEMFDVFTKTENLGDVVKVLTKHPKYPKKRCLACEKRNKEMNKSTPRPLDGDAEVCDRQWENEETNEFETCGGTEFRTVPINNSTVRAILRQEYHCGDYKWFGQSKGKINRVTETGDVVYVFDEKRSVKTEQNRDPRKSPVYIENHHEGIVERDVFNRVQSILNKNQKDVSRRGRPAKGKYTGLLKCSHCGKNLTYDKTSNFPHYRCNNSKGGVRSRKEDGTSICPGGSKMIREADVSTIFKEEIRNILTTPEVHREQIEKVVELLKEREFTNSNTFQSDLTCEHEILAKLEARLEQVLEDPNTPTIILTKVGKQVEDQKRKIEQLTEEQESQNSNPMFAIFDRVDEKYSAVKVDPLEEVQKLAELTFGDYLEQICSAVSLTNDMKYWTNEDRVLTTHYPVDYLVDSYRAEGVEVPQEWVERYGQEIYIEETVQFSELSEEERRETVLEMFCDFIAISFKGMSEEQLDGFRSLIDEIEVEWTEKSSVTPYALMETGKLGDRFSYKRQSNVPTDYFVSFNGQKDMTSQHTVVLSF